MGGLGKKGEVTMYHEISDKQFLSSMKELCFRMMNELKMSIYDYIEVYKDKRIVVFKDGKQITM